MDLEGIASIALLPSGCISGHFIPRSSSLPPNRSCFALYGTELPCDRECSRGEDYRLIKLTLFDYVLKREHDVIVECRGQDAARFETASHVHGWEEDVVHMVEKNKERSRKLSVSFECDTLKAEKDAEIHINRYLPHLVGYDAIVNIGIMKIRGLDFDLKADEKESDCLNATGNINADSSVLHSESSLHSPQSTGLSDYKISSSLSCNQDEENSIGIVAINSVAEKPESDRDLANAAEN
eukprot:TRINITY_DN40458_c0_g1_i1.p1 TRINITY_DN40458_c0_g1~~TRINITY_DN40458_c0_g1_i1.p1  ORF type:complete len:239 (-),score=51.47 TRINITY_DN40458_c0_g1_i1:169-885(-)